jgi:hypothetical protein
MPLIEALEIALEILNLRSIINEAILKIWIFLMHNWQNKVHALSIAVVVLRLLPNGRCGGVGGVVVRYVSLQPPNMSKPSDEARTLLALQALQNNPELST